MDKQTTNVLVSTYEAWKATRRFLVSQEKPLTPWAKRRELALKQDEIKKRLAFARANRRFVIKA